jgi:predicted PurR-regulated permease PerM
MDVTRATLAVLFIGMLIAACFWILLPFLISILWATTIVVTTWPVMLGLQARLRGKRWLAVTGMTVLLLLALSVPALASESDEELAGLRFTFTLLFPK